MKRHKTISLGFVTVLTLVFASIGPGIAQSTATGQAGEGIGREDFLLSLLLIQGFLILGLILFQMEERMKLSGEIRKVLHFLWTRFLKRWEELEARLLTRKEKDNRIPVQIRINLSLPTNLGGMDVDTLREGWTKKVRQLFDLLEKEFPSIKLNGGLHFQIPVERDSEMANGHFINGSKPNRPSRYPQLEDAFAIQIIPVSVHISVPENGSDGKLEAVIKWMIQNRNQLFDLFEDEFPTMKLRVELKFDLDIQTIERQTE